MVPMRIWFVKLVRTVHNGRDKIRWNRPGRGERNAIVKVFPCLYLLDHPMHVRQTLLYQQVLLWKFI